MKIGKYKPVAYFSTDLPKKNERGFVSCFYILPSLRLENVEIPAVPEENVKYMRYHILDLKWLFWSICAGIEVPD